MYVVFQNEKEEDDKACYATNFYWVNVYQGVNVYTIHIDLLYN